MVTQKEVAKHAGVSFITVSRVINNQGNVREETRKRVLEAIAALKYHPNHLGQALNSGRNNTIAIITPVRFVAELKANMYLIGVLDGIERGCRERRLDMHLSTDAIGDPGFDFLRPWRQRKVDGIIFIGLQKMEEAHIREIEEHRIPCVSIADRPDTSVISWIDTDNLRAGQEIVHRLHELGHRRIGFIGLHPTRFINQNISDRVAGYRQAMAALGNPVQESWVEWGDYTPDSGKAAMLRLLKLGADRPTAIVAGNDEMAVGAMTAAQEAGLDVPRDLSFVGFDCSPAGQYAKPRLASHRQPLSEMGYEAMSLLMKQIDDPQVAREQVIFPLSFESSVTMGPCPL